MVKSNIISAAKANRLFWLGRYEERVYMTLHLLRRVYDKMIDGDPEEYMHFWEKLDINDSYSSTGEFTLGMMYDEDNPGSIISSLNYAMDNAIMLREDIKSETMSYIEMSLSLIRKYKQEAMNNVTNLQPLTDWALSFWGSATKRIDNQKIIALMEIGQIIEEMDIQLRFQYPYERLAKQYYVLKHWAEEVPELLDSNIDRQITQMLKAENYVNADEEYRWKLHGYVNHVVMV